MKEAAYFLCIKHFATNPPCLSFVAYSWDERDEGQFLPASSVVHMYNIYYSSPYQWRTEGGAWVAMLPPHDLQKLSLYRMFSNEEVGEFGRG